MPANHLKVLLAISIEMEIKAREPSVRVVGALLEALRDGGLDSGAAIKRLLGQVDQHRSSNWVRRRGTQPPQTVNNILYYVGRARARGARS